MLMVDSPAWQARHAWVGHLVSFNVDFQLEHSIVSQLPFIPISILTIKVKVLVNQKVDTLTSSTDANPEVTFAN